MRSTNIELEAEGVEEPLYVTVDGRDIRKWEAMRQESFIDAPFTYTVLTELGCLAAVRLGKYDGSFDDLYAVVVNARQVDEGDVPRPTQKDPGDGS